MSVALLSVTEVMDLAVKAPKTGLVLKYEGSDEVCEYYPQGLISELEEQAKKKVDDGEFDSFDTAFEHIEDISYICTKSDYDAEQTEIKSENE